MNEKNKIITDSLTRIIDWIKFADTKAAAIGTLAVVYLGFSKDIAVRYLNLVTSTYDNNQTPAKLILPTIAIASLFYFLVRTVVFILLTLKATTKNTSYNPLFFGHIANQSLADYRKAISKRTVKQFSDDILAQTHTNATIASIKYRYVNEALVSIVISTLLIVFAGVVMTVVKA